MISNILTKQKAKQMIQTLKKRGKTTVLVTGCFDLLHQWHIIFLEAAKRQGNMLFVALESDTWIQEKKGEPRPIQDMQSRLRLVSALRMVDGVFPLNVQADTKLLSHLKPDMLAISEGDPYEKEKKLAGKITGTKVVTVCPRRSGFSTSTLIWKCRSSS